MSIRSSPVCMRCNFTITQLRLCHLPVSSLNRRLKYVGWLKLTDFDTSATGRLISVNKRFTSSFLILMHYTFKSYLYTITKNQAYQDMPSPFTFISMPY